METLMNPMEVFLSSETVPAHRRYIIMLTESATGQCPE
jgi:hypothetical protein